MALPAAEYPAATFGGNEQDTANDNPFNTLLAQALDHNKLATEIVAMGGDLRAAFGVEVAANMAALVTAMLAGFADGGLWVGAAAWSDNQGTGVWALTGAGALFSQNRTPNAGNDGLSADIGIITRAAAAKGLTISSVDFVWSTATAVLGTEVNLFLVTTTLTGDGSIPTAALPAGTFDAAHDTTGERVSIKEHTATLTIDAPAKLLTSKGHSLFVGFDDSGGAGTAVVKFYGAMVHFAQALVSGA